MVPLRTLILPRIYKLVDLLSFVFSFFLPLVVVAARFHAVSLHEFLAIRVSVRNFALFLAFLFMFYVLFLVFGIYEFERLKKLRTEIFAAAKATTLGVLLMWGAGVLFDISVISPAFLGVFWLTEMTLFTLGRFTLRTVLARTRIPGKNHRHLLIVGTNSRAVQFAKKLTANPDHGYRLVGFADDTREGKSPEFRKAGFEIKTTLAELQTFLQKHVVDEVLICLPVKSYYTQISDIIHVCEEQGIVIRLSSDFFSLKLARSRPERLGVDTVITIYTGAMTGFPVILKRVVDVCVAASILVIFSPLFLVIAILIKITSKGPVFFVQERVGLNKRKFRMYKFRTMIPGADKMIDELEHLNEVSGPVFKLKNDPRVTRIGKFLRKTSLDELPQIINVLKGDMSLVGPRPLPVRDYEGFDKDWHRRRFSVRPGMTCIWQVNGRSNIPFEKWMELDLQYIDQWSLWLDLKILAKTVPAVFKKQGAV